jgi:hypothetical protein
MLQIMRTHWLWRGLPHTVKLGTRSEETETRSAEDFGFPIQELCGTEGVARVIIEHKDGTYTEYQMIVTEEVEEEFLEDYDEEEVPGSE